MIKEKKKILIFRIVSFIISMIAIFQLIVVTEKIDYPDDYSLTFATFWAILFILFFIGSLISSCKVYEYNENEIIVYAGYFHHYIKVNGEKYDEHNTFIFFTPIILSCSLDDETNLNATISISNCISLKINNRLYKNKSK